MNEEQKEPTLEDLVDKFRDTAIRDLVPYLEVSKPLLRNSNLALKFYDYMLELINVPVKDLNDRVHLVEEVLTTFDHDLSDYLLLAQYQVTCKVVENRDDPIFAVSILYEGTMICEYRISFTTAKLMARKRELELA